MTVLAGADSVRVWSNSFFAEKFGHAFDPGSGDVALLMHGDANANGVHVEGSSYVSGDGIYAVLGSTRGADAAIRLQYLIVLVG